MTAAMLKKAASLLPLHYYSNSQQGSQQAISRVGCQHLLNQQPNLNLTFQSLLCYRDYPLLINLIPQIF